MLFKGKTKKPNSRWTKPISIILIPHGHPRLTVNINLSPIALLSVLVILCLTLAFTLTFAPSLLHYHYAKKQLVEEMNQVREINATLSSLKKMEGEFRRLLGLRSKERIMAEVETTDTGSFDSSEINRKIEEAMQTVGTIKDFLRSQKDIYLATPRGLPVSGSVTCGYGMRMNPFTKSWEFHPGIDISAPPGTAVKATADGVVTFAGWGGPKGGNVVVIAHGFGYSTYYAHNQKITVAVGQMVKRGETIALVGSTGSTTGSHCHYEIRHFGSSANPLKFIKENS